MEQNANNPVYGLFLSIGFFIKFGLTVTLAILAAWGTIKLIGWFTSKKKPVVKST